MFLKLWFYHSLILSLIIIKCNSSDDEALNAVEEEYRIDKDVKQNITLPCWPTNFPNKTASVYWEKRGRPGQGEQVLPDGSLSILNLSKEDTKLYMCRLSQNGHILTKVHLYVRGPPSAPSDVGVSASARTLTVTWAQPPERRWKEEMGGVPTFGRVLYALTRASNSWRRIEKKLPSSQSVFDLSHLRPNSSYEIRLSAFNRFGESDVITRIVRTKEPPSEVERRLQGLDGGSSESSRAWLMATVGVLVVINVLGTIVLLIYTRRNRRKPSHRSDDSEQIELVPNIIENPTYRSDPPPLIRGSSHRTPNRRSDSASNSALLSRSEFV